MHPDDELCLCFHVTRRKVENFIRIEQPRRAGQLAECFGAGTGCGWCRGALQRLFDAAGPQERAGLELPDKGEYARQRTRYVRSGAGSPPPGATPLSDEDVPES